MRLLEVDEAANHIRELVDEDANIIWGSAFNPDLKGKIRVSVVATGIEQSAIGQSERTQSIALGAARAPKRPVLELSDDDGFGAAAPAVPAAPEPEPAPAPTFDLGGASASASGGYDADDTLDLGEAEEEEGDYPPAAPFELTGMKAGDNYGDEYEDDVDDIVDPLAGLRGAEDAPPYGYGAGTPADDEDDALELDDGYAAYSDAPEEGPVQDDLLASADRLAAEDRPVEARLGGGRRRGLLGGEGGGAGGSGGAGAGSTLFERMANLSRSTARDDDEDEDGEDSPALSIPRFLGRQNNQ
jgi:cell division protein FtsZ